VLTAFLPVLVVAFAVCAWHLGRGVFWDRKNNRWRAQVGHNNRKIFMGYFSEPTEAARAYDKKLVQLRGTMGESQQLSRLAWQACRAAAWW
jgi:hypothetical protein